MLSNSLLCSKNTESKSPRVAKAKRRKAMLLLKSAVCDSKKSRFIKE